MTTTQVGSSSHSSSLSLQNGFSGSLVQSSLLRHSTQRPVVRSQIGLSPPHCSALSQSTQRCRASSQTPGVQLSSPVQPTQVWLSGSHTGLAPPQCSSRTQPTQRPKSGSHCGVAP